MTYSFRRLALFILVAFSLLFTRNVSNAALSLTVEPLSQQGLPGDSLTYQIALQNDLTGTVFLNGDDINLPAQDIFADDSSFLFNAPLSLGPGESWSGDAFTLTIGPTTPVQSYMGTFNILGGTDSSSVETVASGQFELVVNSVPEPPTGCLVGVAAAAGICCTRLRKSLAATS
jgi:hypothetical protein